MVFRILLLACGIAVAVAVLGPLAGEAVQELASDPQSSESTVARESAVPASTAPSAIARDGSGHYRVTALVNGGSAVMLVDTGASVVVLTQNDALAAGINPAPSQYTGRARSAAGEMAVAPITIERISVAGIERRSVQGVVAQGNALPTSLLGQSFLSSLHEVRIADGAMTLKD
ncbi:MAG: TIGR02281 family clan AA aspartic protease [Sphingopyxis sp.]